MRPILLVTLVALLSLPALAEGPSQRYVTYIRSTPDQVWKAILDPDQTADYFHQTRVRTSLKVGSPYQHLGKKGQAIIDGKVLKVVPKKELVFSFRFPAEQDAASRVRYSISKAGPDTVKLVILHDRFGSTTKKDLQHGQRRLAARRRRPQDPAGDRHAAQDQRRVERAARPKREQKKEPP